MKLTRARVTNYKSIDDSGWVAIDDVTSLVGKNESGKTAFLHALKRLNPVHGAGGDFDIKDYPRKGYVRYKRVHDTQPAVVVQAEFELSNQEIREVEKAFGEGVIRQPKVIVSKDYKNQLSWEISIDEHAVVHHVLDDAGLPSEIYEHVSEAESWEDMDARLDSIDLKPPSVQSLIDDLPSRFQSGLKDQIVTDCLEKHLPRFVYFDDYSTMRGRISIQDLRQRKESGGYLDEADRTFLSLLSLVGADLEDLEHQTNFEYLKAELESASISISDEIFEFWKQNRELRVQFDLSQANPNDPPPLNSGTILHVRIWNNRHRVSVPFDERSKGFVWFFSFLAYFSHLEEEENADMVLLLDEPGLNLHAMGQQDFLRFIDERLAPKHQVVYTTHSPFMINLKHLHRVRTVQDMDGVGTVISGDVLSNDQETVFPLQMALGYQMAHTLFLAPHCLMVNSPSDLIYIQVLGEMVAASKGFRLDPRWVIIPVGEAENLPTFLSLLGENYVSVAVLMDITPGNKARIEQASQNGGGHQRSPLKWVEVTRVRDADIEDLLDPSFYLKLVNYAYSLELPSNITMKSISDSNPRIVQRVSNYFENQGVAGGRFEPHRPAAYLLEHNAQLRQEIGDDVIQRVASLFERINSLLPTNGSFPNGINVPSDSTMTVAR